MKGIIIYQGKYGATEQYAQWLAEELNFPERASSTINGEELHNYDFIIIGTSVYIGKLQIEKWLKRNLAFIRDKKIFLYQVAGTPPEQVEKRMAYNRSSIPAELFDHCTFFFLPGRLIMNKLSWLDRFLLKMGARMAKDPEDKKNMLTEYDKVKEENVGEIVDEVLSLMPVSA